MERERTSTGKDLLIVDDTLANLQVLSGILKKHGYRVRSAPNGQTAIMIAETESPDLVLLDIVMPDMNGYEVCQHLKRSAATADIPGRRYARSVSPRGIPMPIGTDQKEKVLPESGTV